MAKGGGGGVERAQGIGVDLDGSGGQPQVDHAFGAGLDHPLHGDHVLVVQSLGPAVGLGVVLGVEDHLGDAVAVAQVHEDDAAVVAALGHPAHEGDALANMLGAQGAAVVAALPVAQGFNRCGHEALFRSLFN